MSNEPGEEDLADIEIGKAPAGWVPEEDLSDFRAKDKDDDSDG